MPTLARIDVVTAFLEFDSQILILRRSTSVRTMKKKWGAVSGYLENNDPLRQAIVEINEETGLDNGKIKLVRVGDVAYGNRSRKSKHFIYYSSLPFPIKK